MTTNKKKWKREYTLLLLANVVYIVLFYLIMNKFGN